mmetsp:Transcript_10867/g.19892  ORF Transcript_10867/g.19892 Transcript_10867/m.19892 type:complete len:502 (+) Transcript_10867:168-1673(+)|eukprot:CAMPEP_0197540504 /NCGR_PEP_ID=MMETSP1318-20131121/66059_1 /TAXON_ID=552666 /ORGANISM="Partenskyella glossopodia, Strain RCC365" /LENGTH=501 /DNA_ID=CAMNT_0043099525 /DNA_START=114 /DNA_END=1619 /DNA_ORIENTATION=-
MRNSRQCWLVACLTVAAVSTQGPPRACPIKASEATFSSVNDKGVDLLDEGNVEGACTCFAIALGMNDADAEKKDIALQNYAEARESILVSQVSTPPYSLQGLDASDEIQTIQKVWRELVSLMKSYNITNPSEMMRLSTPYEVYMLHGQLICQKDEPDSALNSFHRTLRVQPSSDANLLIGRIYLGQGRYRKAYEHLYNAYQLLTLHPEPHSDRPRAHTQDMKSTLLLSLEFAGSQMQITPEGEGILRSKVCKQVSALLQNVGVSLHPSDLLIECSRTVFPPLPRNPPPTHYEDHTCTFKLYGQDGNIWTRAGSESAVGEFRQKGYVLLKDVIPETYLHALILRHNEAFRDENLASYVPHQKRSTITNEKLSVFVNMKLAALASKMAGIPTLPTYAFSILYYPGGLIKPHTDRHQNEISLSLNLGLQPLNAREGNPQAWPLYMVPRNKTEEHSVGITMKVNEGVMYRGPKHVHYRKPLQDGLTSMQIIFGFRHVHRSHCNSQ